MKCNLKPWNSKRTRTNPWASRSSFNKWLYINGMHVQNKSFLSKLIDELYEWRFHNNNILCYLIKFWIYLVVGSAIRFMGEQLGFQRNVLVSDASK